MKRLALGLAAIAGSMIPLAALGAGGAPTWTSLPTGEQLQSAYPSFAITHGVEGRATLNCQVAAGGAMQGCQVASETPQGFGFGDAALKIAPYFKVQPEEGIAAVGGAIRIPIHFTVPGPPASSPEDVARLKALDPQALADPIWIELPSDRNIAEVYPGEAINQGKGGFAVLGCKVLDDGRLRACRVLSEAPQTLGFGAAAARLAPHFRTYARTRDGSPTAGAEVVFPVRFDRLQ